MKAKSKKDKLEKDYENFNAKVERAAEQDIKKIHEQTQAIKAEAEKIGETVGTSTDESHEKRRRKKV